jgi:hypothetical protein
MIQRQTGGTAMDQFDLGKYIPKFRARRKARMRG